MTAEEMCKEELFTTEDTEDAEETLCVLRVLCGK